jgi:hypothetical protein
VKRRTTAERFRIALAKRNAARQAADEALEATVDNEIFGDAEKNMQAYDHNLSPKERLRLFKSLKAWPRIVLGLYEAEHALAKKRKSETGDGDEPSDIAYEKVAKVIGVGEDRVKALCAEGRQHLKAGAPSKPKISAAEFKKFITNLH